MWLGVILGLLGLAAGFFGLRKASLIEGQRSEHDRQRRYAEMIHREMTKKDKVIAKKTGATVRRIRRTTRLRRKKKNAAAARSFLSRAKKPW